MQMISKIHLKDVHIYKLCSIIYNSLSNNDVKVYGDCKGQSL